jgi:hypothetical protein
VEEAEHGEKGRSFHAGFIRFDVSNPIAQDMAG